MRESNADPRPRSGRHETGEYAAESGDSDVTPAVENGASGGRGERTDDGDHRSERDPDEHASIRMNDRCATCNEYIGPRAYRLSRVIDTAVATLEIHYCSEACFLARERSSPSSGSDPDPDERAVEARAREGRASTTSETDPQPRDWSYCR